MFELKFTSLSGARIGYSTMGFTLLFLLFSFEISGYAGQMDFGTYIRLQVGMSEAEILVRAGSPDREIFFNAEIIRGDLSDKQMLYIPEIGQSDPHLTIITIESGRAGAIDRIKLFSPPRHTNGGQIEFATFKKLKIGMSEGEVIALAGIPDKEGFVSDTERQLLYIPGSDVDDPYITIITTQRGKVIQIDRKKVFSQ